MLKTLKSILIATLEPFPLNLRQLGVYNFCNATFERLDNLKTEELEG
jgi:hypothetical protein